MNIEVNVSGPLHDGRAAEAARAFVHDAEDQIANDGVDMIHEALHGVIRHPTGYYESRVQTDNMGSDPVITDGGVIYGPWLEGVGSRNQTTRFKGYFTFRRVAQQLQDKAGEIAERVLPDYLRGMQ